MVRISSLSTQHEPPGVRARLDWRCVSRGLNELPRADFIASRYTSQQNPLLPRPSKKRGKPGEEGKERVECHATPAQFALPLPRPRPPPPGRSRQPLGGFEIKWPVVGDPWWPPGRRDAPGGKAQAGEGWPGSTPCLHPWSPFQALVEARERAGGWVGGEGRGGRVAPCRHWTPVRLVSAGFALCEAGEARECRADQRCSLPRHFPPPLPSSSHTLKP